MEQKCRPLRSHPSAHSFIRHCLTMSPSNRPSATELLSNSEYLHESDFQEKIQQFSKIIFQKIHLNNKNTFFFQILSFM